MSTITKTTSDDAKTGGRGQDYAAKNTIVVAQTKGGKDISIARGRSGQMFVINVAGGGIKPPALEGSFTNFDFAKSAIKFYVDTFQEADMAEPESRQAIPMEPDPEPVAESEEFPDTIPE